MLVCHSDRGLNWKYVLTFFAIGVEPPLTIIMTFKSYEVFGLLFSVEDSSIKETILATESRLSFSS